MVVDKYVGRCLDVGSTPTGSIILLHSFAFLGKTLLNQRFLFLSLVFLGILLRKKDTTKDTIWKKSTVYLFIMEPVGVEPTSKHLLTYLSTTIGYVLF